MKYYVYCHITPSQKRYVGISCNPLKRWNSGKGYCKNYRFWRAIKKYGWENIKHVIIASNLSEDEAKSLEAMLVSKWSLTDFRYGYNLREGGDGAPNEESRALMSQSKKGNNNCVGRKLSDDTKAQIASSLRAYYANRPSPMKGRHHTQETINKLKCRVFSKETKQKMSENHADCKGEKNPSARPIIQMRIDGSVVREYPYATIAAKEHNIDLSSIIKCCKGKAKTCGGYRWQYKETHSTSSHTADTLGAQTLLSTSDT